MFGENVSLFAMKPGAGAATEPARPDDQTTEIKAVAHDAINTGLAGLHIGGAAVTREVKSPNYDSIGEPTAEEQKEIDRIVGLRIKPQDAKAVREHRPGNAQLCVIEINKLCTDSSPERKDIIRKGLIKAIKRLGKDIIDGYFVYSNHARSFVGYTMLHYAAHCACPEALQILIHAGASLDKKTKNEFIGEVTALHLAVTNVDADAVAMLVHHGARVNEIAYYYYYCHGCEKKILHTDVPVRFFYNIEKIYCYCYQCPSCPILTINGDRNVSDKFYHGKSALDIAHSAPAYHDDRPAKMARIIKTLEVAGARRAV